MLQYLIQKDALHSMVYLNIHNRNWFNSIGKIIIYPSQRNISICCRRIFVARHMTISTILDRMTEFNSFVVVLIFHIHPLKTFEVEIFATFKLFETASLGFGLFYSKYIIVLCAYYMISYEMWIYKHTMFWCFYFSAIQYVRNQVLFSLDRMALKKRIKNNNN